MVFHVGNKVDASINGSSMVILECFFFKSCYFLQKLLSVLGGYGGKLERRKRKIEERRRRRSREKKEKGKRKERGERQWRDQMV